MMSTANINLAAINLDNNLVELTKLALMCIAANADLISPDRIMSETTSPKLMNSVLFNKSFSAIYFTTVR